MDRPRAVAVSRITAPTGGPMPSFGAPRLLRVPDAPSALLTGDFTGHGRQDIVVGGATEIDVFPNLGGGRFGAPIRTPFATGPGTLTRGVVAMAAGHIDGDSTLDLAVVSGAKVWVFYGNGNGHFRGPAPFAGHSYAPAGHPYQGPDLDAIAVAVLRRGHKPDLVVGEGSTPCCNGVGVEVFLNRGDGSFGAPRVYATGNSYNAATDVAVGDLSGDGVPDIAVLDNVGAFSSGYLTVLQGHGDGAFSPVGSASVEAGVSSLALEPNAGGALTPLVYATGNPYYDGTQPSINVLSGYHAPPPGNPSAPLSFAQQRLGTTLQGAGAHPGGDPGTLAVAREPWGTLVAAVANRDQGTVGVRVGATPQSLGALQEFATGADPGAAPVAVALADLSGQGRLDLVAANAGDHTIGILADDSSLPARASALVGEWTSSGWTPGDPANNGPLKVQVAVTGTQFVATLLTGNAYIPAGQIELDGTYTGAPDFFVWVQFAAAGHKSVTWIYGQVGVRDTNHFTMTNTYNTATVTFTRLSPGGSGGNGGNGGNSPPITCATIPPSQRSNFVASYAGWRVTGSVSAQAGLTMNDVTLLKTGGMAHDRYMAYRISIPYVNVQLKPGLLGAVTSGRSFRLEPDSTQYDHGTFVARTVLALGPRVCQTPADPHEAPYDAKTHPYFPLRPIDQLSIEADYRVWFDAHPTPASPYLTIEQLYKFYAPFDENNHDYDLAHGLACEPSQEIGGFLSEGGMRCARWKPLVFYFYSAHGAPARLPLITVPYLLNFAPDHRYVQGAVFIHDCDRSEMLLGFRHGTCLTGEDPKDVTLADNHETVQQAISAGHAVFWDNVHMTDQKHVGAPVRPPGCEECVHIHWRWGTVTLGLLPWNDDPRAKLLYGDGQPLLCDDGHVNPTTGCQTDQSVDIALVNDRPGIEDVTDFRQTVDGLPSGQLYGDGDLLGPYVNGNPKPNILFWYVATATDESQDTFFAHGGFFDAATP